MFTDQYVVHSMHSHNWPQITLTIYASLYYIRTKKFKNI